MGRDRGVRKPGDTLATTGITPPRLGDAPTLPSPTEPTPKPPPPTEVDRFVIVKLIGTGGMGEVYSARDPDLDRQVAIKLLRPELPARADVRLHREARAMAKLSHPNLVTVYEVGKHADQLFVAMELIDGETLHSWVTDRPWREIVRAYVAAGRGLAAAHAAGIVHRDFKPENVLVSKDGRVAVGDFGLAFQADDVSDSGSSSTSNERVTQEGALVGTLRYMAPEQLARRRADVRSDQFSFCVALWEALDGHPFDRLDTTMSSSADARREAIQAGLIRRRLRGGVPSQISHAVARGLAPDPAARWPSMTKLLDAIERGLHRNRRVAIVGVVSALAVGLVITTAMAWSASSTRPDDPCANAADRIHTVWTPEGSRNRLIDGFRMGATTGPHVLTADELASRTAVELDRYALAWSSMAIDSCQAAARGNDVSNLYVRRTRCLDRRLYELEETVDRLTHQPTSDIVQRALQAVSHLNPIADCGNASALLDRPLEPTDPKQLARIDKLSTELSRLKAQSALGIALKEPVLVDHEREADEIGRSDLIADAKYLAGRAAYLRGDAEVAVAKLRAAALAASRVHDDAGAVHALTMASEGLLQAGRPNDALEVDRAAEIAAARGGDRPDVRADVLDSLGATYAALGKFDDADKAFAESIRLLDSVHASPIDIAPVLNSWANELSDRSDYARALPLSTRAVQLYRELEGDHSPDLARALQSNGNLLVNIGKLTDAKVRYDEALAIKQAFYGPKESTVALTLHSMGNVYGQTGDRAKADQIYRDAYEIWLAKSGPDNANTLMARYSIATNLRHLGKLAESLAILEDVLARRRALKPPPQAKIANVLDQMASVYDDMNDLPKAIAMGLESLAIREKVLGPETGDVAESLVKLAEIYIETNDCAKVTEVATRALAIIKKQPSGDADAAAAPTLSLATCAARAGRRDDAIAGYKRGIDMLATATAATDIGIRGNARYELARLVWPTNKDEARALATAALADLAALPAELPKVKAWLTSH